MVPRLLDTFYHKPGVQGERKGCLADETSYLLREELCGM